MQPRAGRRTLDELVSSGVAVVGLHLVCTWSPWRLRVRRACWDSLQERRSDEEEHDDDGTWLVGRWSGADVLFWGLIVTGIVWLVRAATNSSGRGDERRDGRESARDILDERFASGELSAAEYRERRAAVEANR